ncbi:GyrI-like domain-containing protein [Bacteroidota bacterium]
MTGKPDTVKDYFERINKVLLYINNHMEEKMDLDKLAEVSNFSTFHFHRIMKAYLNEPLWSYIVRLRLDTAARLLKMSEKPINDIAYSIGYETPSSFNKAFKKRFDVAPKEFRESKGFFNADGTFIKPALNMTHLNLKPKIKNVKDRDIIYIQVTGLYSEKIGDGWAKVCHFASKNKLWGFNTEFLGLGYDSPQITERENCRYEACLTVRKPVKPEGEIGFKTLKEGRYAIFRYKGSYENFDKVYAEILNVWYPKSGETLRNVPSYERYLNNPDKVKPENYLTEIYIPIE